MRIRLGLIATVLAAVAAASGCGGGEGSAPAISADGSSTVGPFMQRAAERFGETNGVRIDVSLSRSGRGLERFCSGEIDIANTSRPIDEDEAAECREAGIDYVSFQVASDALTVAIYRPILHDWVTCLTVDQLRKIWEPGSTVSNWRQVDASFPDVPLKLFANPDSGTFRYFNRVINGDPDASRTDYGATEDHSDTVEAVAGERGALGYFGFSYYFANRDRLSALEIDGGNGCVAPAPESVHDGSYVPLGRRLFIYVSQDSLDRRRDLRSFVRYILENAETIADESLFVPLNEDEAERQMQKFITAIS
jgi:phosphate transport system substrate-binding protein